MEKTIKRTLAKAIDPEAKTVTGYPSTFGWDRDQERFVKGAWNLNDYLKNPVVLWSHDISAPPIAKTINIMEDEHGLSAVAQFNPSDPRSMDVFNLYKSGFLNAFSVGFIRREFVMEDMGNGEKGLAITKADLYEYSAVSVPANPGALVSRDIAETAVRAMGEKVIEVIQTKGFGKQYLVLPLGPKDPDGEENDPENPEGTTEPEPEEPAAAAAPDLEASLKSVIELAKIAKSTPLDNTKRSLLMTASQVFNEILQENGDGIKGEDLIRLKEVLIQFAGVLSLTAPEAAPIIQKTISQIEKAITGRAA